MNKFKKKDLTLFSVQEERSDPFQRMIFWPEGVISLDLGPFDG
jgi:hypothetical protein